jgi:hypothetical protein
MRSLISQNHAPPVSGFTWEIIDRLALNATFPKPGPVDDRAKGAPFLSAQLHLSP